MTNNEAFYFLGKCLAIGESEEIKQDVIKTIRQQKVDWDRFVSMASSHLVLPSVYLRFKKHGILPIIEVELSDHLLMVYELNCKRNQEVLAQIDRINRLFASEGIVPIYLKGTANLLDHLYEDEGERIIGDIDLLVSETEFLVAANLLKGVGYDHFHKFHEDMQSDTKHFPRLVHPTEPLDVEVHRSPVETDQATYFNYEVIRQETKRIETSPHCFVLSDRHKVILNFMHAFMANDVRQMHIITFRNMVDLLFLSHRVEVYEILAGQAQYASNALMYFDYLNQAMGLTNKHTPNLRLRIIIWQNKLLRKPIFSLRAVKLLIFLLTQFWIKYVLQIVKSIYNKQIRKSLFYKISDPTWYKRHFNWYCENLGLRPGNKR